jgi:predicted O-methyltransferase YrrM
MTKSFFAGENALNETYLHDLFPNFDEAWNEIRSRALAAKMPDISVSSLEGQLLFTLAKAAGAKKIVEIGTLAGFSTLALAKALPPEGHLWTFEFSDVHAKVAQETFQKYGVHLQVSVLVGAAIEKLPSIESEGPFDVVFIDANKSAYPGYLDWAARNLRAGGLVIGDNTFGWGDVAKDGALTGAHGNDIKGLALFNQSLAKSGKFTSMMIPTSEGLMLGVKT